MHNSLLHHAWSYAFALKVQQEGWLSKASNFRVGRRKPESIGSGVLISADFLEEEKPEWSLKF